MQNTHRSEVLSAAEMKIFEKLNFKKKNSYFFMQRAGYEVFKFIRNNFKKKQSIIVLCGPGNNGGDGFITAKYLTENNYKTTVFTFANKHRYKGDALKALKKFDGITKNLNSFKLTKNTLIVDALFGIGLKRKIKGRLKKIFKLINSSKNSVVSVDIPSGISSDDGQILGSAIKADFTITFHRKKVGHISGYGKKFAGKLKVADIGFSEKKMKSKYLENSPLLWMKYFPWKNFSGHKYSRGKVVIYGGQKEFTGAAMLAAQAA